MTTTDRPDGGAAIERFAGDYRFLSNFHPSEVALDGEPYPTVEHAFQAAKTLDAQQRAAIRRAPSPGAAKRLGRNVDLIDGWDRRRVAVMRGLLVDKFTRHPDLAARLLATGTRRLVEANTWGDQFWGVCDGRGDNQLGRLLMSVRAHLAAQRAPEPRREETDAASTLAVEALGDRAVAELIGRGLASLRARVSDSHGDYDPEWAQVLGRACDAWDEFAAVVHPPAGATR